MKQKSLLLRLGGAFVKIFYRLHVTGLDNLPKDGFLLLPNHVTWVDAILLQVATPRPVRFMVFEPIYRNPFLNPIFRLLKAIPISPRKAKEAMREASQRIKEGEIVCIFPEGELSRNGTLLKLRRGFELIAHLSDAPVLPVWLDQLWGSIFSFYGNRFFKKIPKKVPYPVTISFGKPIPSSEVDISDIRERMLILGEEAFQQRPQFKGNLAVAALRGLKSHASDIVVHDGMDGSSLTRGTLLAAAITLAQFLKETTRNPRVAIMLPPGRGALIANLAVGLAGKVPVNLNFTAGKAAIAAAVRIGELTDVITAGPLLSKVGDLPLPENVLKIEEILPPLKSKVARWRIAVALLPWWGLTKILGLKDEGDHAEASVLFTSGSSGDPKGVVLSHRNILSNVSQFSQMLNLQKDDSILASLPFFHSFGCTVTLWFPLIERVKVVTYPNPVDAEKNASLIEKYKISLVLATPTFLRGYLRKVEPEKLASVKLLVTGAEKLPRDVAVAFEERFGIHVHEGYGLTETSPVVSVNLPDPPKRSPEDEVQPASRPGSVGKLAPGIAAQIRHPETGEHLPLTETGMLWLKGPNIFEGYLKDPKKTAEVLVDDWFITGDLGRFDDDGFLYIEGRISRFSKIGGEMVPHETLEAKIYQALELVSDQRLICVVGVPDPAKGEAIILLSTVEIDLQNLRSKLLANGVPALWIPKVVRRIASIPVLGSGKLDIKGCKELALAPSEEKAEV